VNENINQDPNTRETEEAENANQTDTCFNFRFLPFFGPADEVLWTEFEEINIFEIVY